MKKYFILNLIILSILCNTAPMHSAQIDDPEILDKISKIGFYKIISQDPKKEICDLFNKINKASTNQDIKKLYNIYADDYISSDGFDKETYFEMIKKTWEIYPKVSYTTEVKDIQIDNNYATVQVIETAIGETKEAYENISEKGTLSSKSLGYYYLHKKGTDWEVTSSTILQETATLKYGVARSCDISITAPNQVKSGENYTVSLNMSIPEHSFIIGSITNEPIIYPQLPPKDVFRTVKKDGMLERIFIANKDNHNEFATASIGFTKAAVVDSQSINIQVTGMAFVMTRVNVVNKVNPPFNKTPSAQDISKDKSTLNKSERTKK